eukprot:1061479-Amphidinium_carterae.1
MDACVIQLRSARRAVRNAPAATQLQLGLLRACETSFATLPSQKFEIVPMEEAAQAFDWSLQTTLPDLVVHLIQ